MGINATTRRLAAWIACLAILFAALAPSVSHALGAARGDVWTEICSPGGARMVKVGLDQADGGPAAGAATAFEHCSFCAVHGGASPLPAGQAGLAQLLTAGTLRPLLFFQAPHPLPVWNAAQSRAPPRPS
jgi:hypothetical protein